MRETIQVQYSSSMGEEVPDEVKLREVFEVIDKDKNGTLEKRELLVALQHEEVVEMVRKIESEPLQHLLKPQEFEEMFMAIATTTAGHVTADEFTKFAAEKVINKEVPAYVEPEGSAAEEDAPQPMNRSVTKVRAVKNALSVSNADRIKHRLAFTPDELNGLESAFTVIDEDLSGTLDTKEIFKMLLIADCSIDELDVRNLLDGHENGISFNDFISLCAEGKNSKNKQINKIVQSIMKAALSFSDKVFDSDDKLDEKELNQLRLVLRKASYVPGGFKPELIFKRWNKNGDGHLDYEELHDLIFSLGPDLSEAEFGQFFKYLDHDGDGGVGIEEFVAFIKQDIGKVIKSKKRNLTLAEQDASYIKGANDDRSVKRFDGYAKSAASWSKNNVLGNKEITLIKNKIRAAAYYGKDGQDLSRLFLAWDKDHNGVLDRSELATEMKKLLPTSVLSEEELTQILDALDNNGDGEIECAEFVKFMETNPPVERRTKGLRILTSRESTDTVLAARAEFTPQELAELETS